MSPVSQDEEEEEEDDLASKPTPTSTTTTSASSTMKNVTTSDSMSGCHMSGELVMEIDSLNNMSRRQRDENAGNDVFVRTPLPSFSTIISGGNVPVVTTTCSSDTSLLSVLQSTSVADPHSMSTCSSHNHPMILGEDRNDDRDGQCESSAVHSRRSSVDTGGLIIHESLPGSRHGSPSVSRRTSIDHGLILQHLNDRRSSVDQPMMTGSGLCMISDLDSHRSEPDLPDLASHHGINLPFLTHHDHTDTGSRITGSGPPTPANGLHPLCTIMDPISRQYHSMPNSPRPQAVTSVSALASLASCVEKAITNSTLPDDLMTLSMKSSVGGIMDQLTIRADMDTSTNVTFSDHQPILSLSPGNNAIKHFCCN